MYIYTVFVAESCTFIFSLNIYIFYEFYKTFNLRGKDVF